MKNKKAQMNVMGIFLIAFVAIIVAIALFQAAAENIGSATNTVTLANVSTSSPVNNTAFYITDYKYITDPVFYNATGNKIIGSGNYTITNNVVYNGQEAIKVLPSFSSAVYGSGAWLISGTAEPTGYISDAAGRSIAGIIVIFAALAIAIVALVPALRSGLIDMVKG